MRNRAKCKLCGDIIESIHTHDFVSCSCGEISVDGGQSYLRSLAKNKENFIRLNDDDSVFEMQENKLVETAKVVEEISKPLPTKKELIDMLAEMSRRIEELPAEAMVTPINHYDLSSLLILLLAIFKADCADTN